MISLQEADKAVAAGVSLLKLLRVCANGDLSFDDPVVRMGLRAFTRRLRLVLAPATNQLRGLPGAMPAHKKLLDAGKYMLGWIKSALAVVGTEAGPLRAGAAPGEEGGPALNLAPEEPQLKMAPQVGELLAKVARSALGDPDELEAERANEARWLLERVPPDKREPALPALPCIWYHGGRSYSSDGLVPRVVSAERHNLLQRFLDRDQAVVTSDLEEVVTNPFVVIKKLIGQFGKAAITQPQYKGEGYFIRVRSAPAK